MVKGLGSIATVHRSEIGRVMTLLRRLSWLWILVLGGGLSDGRLPLRRSTDRLAIG
jgi:hypothetical protein